MRTHANTKGFIMAKTPSERDAIDVLMEDHKRVQRLFKDFDRVERDDAEAVRDLVKTACVELQIHSMLEEELFYPAVRAQVEDDDERNQDLLNEAEVEHESVEELIAKLQDLQADDPMYYASFSVLAEYVKHHIKEEEKELFSRSQEDESARFAATRGGHARAARRALCGNRRSGRE